MDNVGVVRIADDGACGAADASTDFDRRASQAALALDRYADWAATGSPAGSTAFRDAADTEQSVPRHCGGTAVESNRGQALGRGLYSRGRTPVRYLRTVQHGPNLKHEFRHPLHRDLDHRRPATHAAHGSSAADLAHDGRQPDLSRAADLSATGQVGAYPGTGIPPCHHQPHWNHREFAGDQRTPDADTSSAGRGPSMALPALCPERRARRSGDASYCEFLFVRRLEVLGRLP